jgi:hypothetical protein
VNLDNTKSLKLVAAQWQPWEGLEYAQQQDGDHAKDSRRETHEEESHHHRPQAGRTTTIKLISKTSKEEDFNFHLHLTKQGEP